MPTTVKRAGNSKNQENTVISDSVKNYVNEPYFIKKAEKARETIERVGLPGQKKK